MGAKHHIQQIERRINYLRENIKIKHSSQRAYAAEVSELQALQWAVKKLTDDRSCEADDKP